MTSTRTRPTNNDHCFEGLGKRLWLMEARGFRVSGIRKGPDGARIGYQLDSDGGAMQNGGMFAPQETRMNPGLYYRFFGTISHNRYGAKGSMAGGWWIEPDLYFQIRDWARAQDVSLAKAAQRILVIPDGWHDCGYVGRAMLKVRLKAYVGRGKPATGRTSPHNPNRDPDADPLQIAPAHIQAKQWFVPGERELLKTFFETQATRQVIKKGAFL